MPSQSTLHAYSTASGDWVKVTSNSTGMLKVVVSDGTDNAGVDSYVSALQCIDVEHHEVHEGEMFTLSNLASLANGATSEILFVVGPTKNPHIRFEAIADGVTNLYFYETPTYSSTGIAITEYDMNRSTANSSEGTFYSDPTITNAGTALITGYIAGGEKSFRTGGEVRSGSEFVLATSEVYLFRVVNNSGIGGSVLSLIEFYEV